MDNTELQEVLEEIRFALVTEQESELTPEDKAYNEGLQFALNLVNSYMAVEQ